MIIIAGLGNPGQKYKGTRHNTGFMVAEELAKRHGISLSLRSFSGICGSGRIEEKRVMIIEPQTYMNVSGQSIREITGFYRTDVQNDLIVIYDDVDLSCGRLRIRKSGSAGGHNGMKSIIGELNRQDFVRLRVGVGKKPPEWDLADWVLSPFRGEDAERMKDAVRKAADAVECILTDGVDQAMNRYNQEEEKQEEA